MIKFNSRQSDCARHARKNEYADTVNFTSQIASSICTATFTKRVKPDATIFKSRCSRTVVCHRFDRVEALPLIFIRLSRLANSSPTNRRNPAIRSCNDRELSHKNSGEMPRSITHNFPAIAGRWKSQCRRISARAARETVCNRLTAAMSQSEQQTMQHPAKHLTRRLVEIFDITFSTMTPNNYEHINHNTRSRSAAKNCGGISTRPNSRGVGMLKCDERR
jgi:hypothetical protein